MGTSRLARRPINKRFWEKVDKKSNDECWQWTAAKTHYGYGVIGLGTNKLIRAHRLSYEIHNGPIPKGKVVRHTCDNPPCVNPNHLLIGTHKDNTQDCINRNRARGPKRKLSDKQVRRIIASNGTVRSIAKEFNVSPGYISMIRNKKRRHQD